MRLPPPYDRLLYELPGVKSFQWAQSSGSAPEIDGIVKLRTTLGVREFAVEIKASNLTGATVEHLLGLRRQSRLPLLLLAPQVGGGTAVKLIDAGVHYLDARGNCHIDQPPLFIHIEGKSRQEMPMAGRGIRAAGYQTLFVFLAEPASLDSTVRAAAERAGVSRQAVSDMRRRLVEEEYLLETKGGLKWSPRRVEEALNLWLSGYETTVRPALLWGTYRTQVGDPGELEAQLIELAATRGAEFRWGGSAAGARLAGHYRGKLTALHVHAPNDILRRLQAVPDRRGNLLLLDAFGTVNWEADSETVHPLLVYSEMLAEGNERAREAAAEIYDRYVRPNWGARL